MLNRRRSLLGYGKRLLYQLRNQSMSAGSHVDTGIPVLKAGLSVTIALDYTIITNPGGGTALGALYKLMQMSTSREICIGKYNGGDSKLNLWWYPTSNSNYTQLSNTTTNAGRKRIIITHEQNSNTITVYTKMDDSAVQTFTKSSTYVPINQLLSLGYSSDEGRTTSLPEGTLNDISIYNYIWSQDQITEFMS